MARFISSRQRQPNWIGHPIVICIFLPCSLDDDNNKEEIAIERRHAHLCLNWTVANNYTWTLFYLSFQLPPDASYRYCCHFSIIHHWVSEWECVLCSCSFSFLWIQWHQSVNGSGSGSKQKRKEFAHAVNRHGMSKRFKMRSMRERNVQITFVIIFSTSASSFFCSTYLFSWIYECFALLSAQISLVSVCSYGMFLYR